MSSRRLFSMMAVAVMVTVTMTFCMMVVMPHCFNMMALVMIGVMISVVASMSLVSMTLLSMTIVSVVSIIALFDFRYTCLLYTSPSPRDLWISRMPSSA